MTMLLDDYYVGRVLRLILGIPAIHHNMIYSNRKDKLNIDLTVLTVFSQDQRIVMKLIQR
jgi:hypothetical protein